MEQVQGSDCGGGACRPDLLAEHLPVALSEAKFQTTLNAIFHITLSLN